MPWRNVKDGWFLDMRGTFGALLSTRLPDGRFRLWQYDCRLSVFTKSYEELAKWCSRPVINGTIDEDKKIDIDQKIDNEEAATEKTENDETAEMDIT